ncbi:MAG: hypothetical protein IPH20_02660 [Bacteroidales bacterium]|nr:hypothetical protein [Bacteroidales bacterium]
MRTIASLLIILVVILNVDSFAQTPDGGSAVNKKTEKAGSRASGRKQTRMAGWFIQAVFWMICPPELSFIMIQRVQ